MENVGYVDINGYYYEGDRQGNDTIVPRRPSYLYKWDFDKSEWVEDREKIIETTKEQLLCTDKYMARVVEDIYDWAVAQGFTPDAIVSERILTRKDLRNKIK